MVKISKIKDGVDQEGKVLFGEKNLLTVKPKLIKSKKIKDKDKEIFFSELGTLVSAGVDVYSSIGLMSNGSNNIKEKENLNIIREALEKGDGLSEALMATLVFSVYDYQSIKIGEETGLLATILDGLSLYYKRKINQRKSVIKAITYPAIVLITAFLALFFMLNFVVPMFEDVFSRADSELPGFTKVMIQISHFFRDHIELVVGFLFLGTIIFMALNKLTNIFSSFSNYLLKFPFVGEFIKLLYLEKVFHALALLTKSKITMFEALQFVNGIIQFRPINNMLIKVVSDINNGVSLSTALKGNGLLDDKMIMLIKIGEEVNGLEGVFEKLYLQISERLEYKIDQSTTLLEPVLIVFVGSLVALILIAMYLPLFKIGTSVF